MSRLVAHGIALELPRGWSGRVFRGPGGTATLHAGDFPLALDDGAFGGASTASMPGAASFIALTEYLAGGGLEPGRGLFAATGIPRPLDPTSFASDRLAHPRPDQAGAQHFFTAAGRPLCLYVVISGDRAARKRALPRVDQVLATLRIEAE